MDADRLARIRANADAMLKKASEFKPVARVEISDDDWNAIEVMVEEDHTIQRKKPRTNHTWNNSGRVKKTAIKRIKFEQKLKAKGITVEEWRSYSIKKQEPKLFTGKATLIKKNPE